MADQNTRNNQPGSPGGGPGAPGGGAGGNAPGSGRKNPADNLSHEDRVRGGERSAAMQHRDASGQFAGRKKDTGSPGQNAGRQQQQQGGGPGTGAGRNAGNTNR